MGDNKPVSFKGSWTVEEDSILRDTVMCLGEGKWSLIAQSLPGRIGKQKSNIKKNDKWMVEEDMVLIEAHKSVGKRWSTIVRRFLPGRPENDIKNHWNSTARRTLDSKRRLKKKSQQVPPRQLSILEEYIRSVEQDSKSTAPQPPASPPVIDSSVVHTSPPEMEMHLNAPNQPGASNLNNSLLPDLNVGANGYYNEAGPSNICGSGDPADDANTVLELGSRGFIMPSSEEVSLGLARFK